MSLIAKGIKEEGALKRMAGKNEADTLIALLKGIKTLKDEVTQLCSEVKNDNWQLHGSGQQEILIV